MADRYLKKYGESAALLANGAWTKDKADVVASAMLDWAKDNGASVYVHWFQPMGASGFRHGQSGQVYNTMMDFDAAGKPCWKVRHPGGGCGAAHGSQTTLRLGYDSKTPNKTPAGNHNWSVSAACASGG